MGERQYFSSAVSRMWWRIPGGCYLIYEDSCRSCLIYDMLVYFGSKYNGSSITVNECLGLDFSFKVYCGFFTLASCELRLAGFTYQKVTLLEIYILVPWFFYDLLQIEDNSEILFKKYATSMSCILMMFLR